MRNGKGWKSEFALQQLAQQVQLHESQNRHQKRQHHRQATIPVRFVLVI